MRSPGSSPAKPGLRERKKQRTRETIERVALRLFDQRGYANTTLEDIAEAADVSRGTIFSYFDSKEDILFGEETTRLEQLEQMLEHRPGGTSTIDTLLEFIHDIPFADERIRLRNKILSSEEEALQDRRRARTARLERMIATSIAQDLGATPDDIRPALVAGSLTAGISALRQRAANAPLRQTAPTERPPDLDDVLTFLRGGLDALQAATGHSAPDSARPSRNA
jgi:AcrR family transcriptional regulator